MNKHWPHFRLGLVINPYAGVGGPVGFKGSDADSISQAAAAGQLALTAPQRATTFLRTVLADKPEARDCIVVTVAGLMGAETCAASACGWIDACYCPAPISTREDTRAAVKAIMAAGVDLLVFVGGDGTARDVCSVIGSQQLVLGVPAGVKMHSGVFAVNPYMAAALVVQLMAADLVNVSRQEVRDIDEEAFRKGVVKSQFFGEMRVPQAPQHIQAVKQGGFEIEEAVLLDIAEHLLHHAEPNTLFILGPGSTTLTIQKNWGLHGTLLGVDVVCDGRLIAADADAKLLAALVAAHQGPILFVVTAIGGQGHIIGRGNQQITSPILRQIGREGLRVVATRSKLQSLQQRPLLIDSGDPQLDQDWQGYLPVIIGFDDVVLYPLGCCADA